MLFSSLSSFCVACFLAPPLLAEVLASSRPRHSYRVLRFFRCAPGLSRTPDKRHARDFNEAKFVYSRLARG